ncbi:MAG: 30S ribosomal protein S8 [Candidatus Curtissbacteria bacterium]|nr:30S ribosomal protein S8 [Candidatus Curtissbacteria bacterium]
MDPIADMLITIKNGYMARKPSVIVPLSKFRLEIAKVLEAEKLIGKINVENKKITIDLIYENNKPKISQIQKVSKLGLRVYVKSKKIPNLKGGRGTYVLSTPQGVMTGKDAKSKQLGGEVICKVW